MSRHAPATSRCTTLFDYTDPVSPHLAAARDGIVTRDTEIVEAVVAEIKMALGRSDSGGDLEAIAGEGKESLVLVESAGGVLSPAPSGSLQADAFRPMRLPVLLVGDSRLGGIGATLSALECLRIRGYSVLGVALIAQGIICMYVCILYACRHVHSASGESVLTNLFQHLTVTCFTPRPDAWIYTYRPRRRFLYSYSVHMCGGSIAFTHRIDPAVISASLGSANTL